MSTRLFKEAQMKATRVLMLALVPPVAIALLSTGVATASGSFGGRGLVRITKECTEYSGAAGAFCTITSSNIPAIPVGSKVLYSQAAGVPANLLDSNVVLDAGSANRAVGRCTLDLLTGLGICTFSDGTGSLAGFRARVNVSPPGEGSVDWTWRGKFQFDIFWPWR
jgi:hypothetical protein